MAQLQNLIHELDAGKGKKYLWYGIMAACLVLLILNYNTSGFKNLSNPEAMDAAQLARNVAEGKGWRTSFVRPFSVYLTQKASGIGTNPVAHASAELPPDISNPPVYPLVLAGMMKLIPATRYQAIGDRYSVYGPDFWISLFNQLILVGTAFLLFFLARRWFDSLVAWLSLVVFLGTDLFWRFSISGLPTMLLMLIFLALAGCLTRLETDLRAGNLAPGRQLRRAAAMGLLTGTACLTRYSFGWLILPVAGFLWAFSGNRRVPITLTAVAGFLVPVFPWMLRNYHLSRAFFGTAGYATYSLTYLFPEYKLERAFAPDFGPMRGFYIWYKFLTNSQAILQDDLPRMSGSLVGAFFLVGLLVRFKNASLNRLRFFVLFSLACLIVAQALVRTQLSVDSPVVNSENLLVVLSPLVIVFGVSLFLSLLDQMNLPIRELREVLIGGFCVLLCLPALSAYFGYATGPGAYPPYYPPDIQKTSNWMHEDELTMSDVPWAVAWYGRHQCVWLTDSAQADFTELNRRYQPVRALFLTPLTLDAKLLSQTDSMNDANWSAVAINVILKEELPGNLPYKFAPRDLKFGQLFLTDSKRWGAQPADRH